MVIATARHHFGQGSIPGLDNVFSIWIPTILKKIIK